MSSSSKRLFSQALLDVATEANPAKAKPGSASGAYEGSRKEKQRYEYTGKANCGFVELNHMSVWSVKQYKQYLEAVAGVKKVICHPKGSKEMQGNGRNDDHYQARNCFVYSDRCTEPMEFELTRCNHMKAM